MYTDQACGRRNKRRIVPCLGSVGQLGNVLETSPDSVPSMESASIHRPTGNVVTVVNLLQADASRNDDRFHCCRMLQRDLRLDVEWLDQDTTTAACQPRTCKGARILGTEQSRLDPHSPRQQMLAELANSRLALIRRHQIGQFVPACNDPETLSGSVTIVAEVLIEI